MAENNKVAEEENASTPVFLKAAGYVPVETTLTLANNIYSDSNPELAKMIKTIQSDESLVSSLENLRKNNPKMFQSTLQRLVGGEGETPEGGMKAAQAMLENDVLRGQLTEMINNVADNPNITDQHVTDFINASKEFKSVIEKHSETLAGNFGMLVGTNEEYNKAHANLAQAYSNLGMSKEDFNEAFEQGIIIGINGKIGDFDNLGSGLSATANAAMFDAGAMFKILGLGGLASSLGIADKGLSDLLVKTGIFTEAQITGFMDMFTEFLTEFDLADFFKGLGISEGFLNKVGVTNNGFDFSLTDNIKVGDNFATGIAADVVDGTSFPIKQETPEQWKSRIENRQKIDTTNGVTDKEKALAKSDIDKGAKAEVTDKGLEGTKESKASFNLNASGDATDGYKISAQEIGNEVAANLTTKPMSMAM